MSLCYIVSFEPVWGIQWGPVSPTRKQKTKQNSRTKPQNLINVSKVIGDPMHETLIVLFIYLRISLQYFHLPIFSFPLLTQELSQRDLPSLHGTFLLFFVLKKIEYRSVIMAQLVKLLATKSDSLISSPEPTRQKERTKPYKLSCDLYMNTVVCTQAHTQNKCNS